MNAAQYELALQRIEDLVNMDPENGSPLATELTNLVAQVENYEKLMGYTFDDAVSTGAIYAHFDTRQRVMPTVQDALMFITTEVAEVMELDLSRRPYVRNHPDDKEPFTPERYAEELGDIIYMAVIAGRAEGVDPIAAMLHKMRGQLGMEA